MFPEEIFQYLAPTRLIYGPGSLARLGPEVLNMGTKSVLLVSDQGVARAGLLQGALDSLKQQDILVETFTDVQVDPDVSCVAQGVERVHTIKADLIIGMGGGSPMCAAKAIAIVASNGGAIRDYEGFGKATMRPLPCVCIPTTAGSGTEVSAVTIVTDADRHIKMAIGSPLAYPPLAILDPELLLNLPFRQAAASGVDALSHAIEACLTTQATPLTDALALGAVKLLGENLVRAAKTTDLVAKSACMLGSSMANMACGNARLGLNHAITWPISSLFSVPHGLANGIMLPYVLEFTMPEAAEAMDRVAIALGATPVDQQAGHLAQQGLDRLKNILIELDFPTRFTQDQLDPKRIPEMVNMLQEGIYSLFRQVNLRVAGREELADLYHRSLQGWD
ncbi:MAG: iron-containing alcohol dehydrogenase [Anaerolineales bacterium]|nr:iron-containing alcohol dehydrogenase [Anaerolineales bacterium]